MLFLVLSLEIGALVLDIGVFENATGLSFLLLRLLVELKMEFHKLGP